MDGMDDVKREGVTTRAALRETQRELAEVREDLRKAQADARMLAEFIERSGAIHSWAHDDVVRLLLASQGAVALLRQRNMAAAARGAPASHILYDRMIREAEEETAAQIEALLKGGLGSPERLTEDMRADIVQRLRSGT